MHFVPEFFFESTFTLSLDFNPQLILEEAFFDSAPRYIVGSGSGDMPSLPEFLSEFFSESGLSLALVYISSGWIIRQDEYGLLDEDSSYSFARYIGF